MENKKHTILIVDDEIMVIRSLLRVLENDNYEIFHTIDPIEAVEKLVSIPVDVIISDQRMPEITGLDLMMKAKDIQPNAVRILMSGYSDIDIVITAINEGRIFQYITKPWDNDKLIEIVHNAILLKTEEDEKQEILSVNLEKNESWNAILTQMNSELEKKNINTINALTKILKAKDKDLFLHSECVAETAVTISILLGLSQEKQDSIRYAGLLHDIGKISIRDKIMYKAGSLDDDEYNDMKLHPSVGAEILREIDFLESIAMIVEQHHERVDGFGYPNMLSQDDILFESQIVSVADTYEALRENRVYRKGMSPDEAFKIVSDDMGKKFRSDVVEALGNMIKANTGNEVVCLEV